jgi:hypothetical protein
MSYALCGFNRFGTLSETCSTRIIRKNVPQGLKAVVSLSPVGTAEAAVPFVQNFSVVCKARTVHSFQKLRVLPEL